LTSNEGLIVLVDISNSDVIGAFSPIVGIVFPNNCAQAQRVGNGPDPIVNIAEGRLWTCQLVSTPGNRNRLTLQQVGVTPTTILIASI
jgi:hypothetical protein